MKTDLFDYPLPERLIAQAPIARRDESRLLVVDRATRQIEHRRFRDLGEYLRSGDTLFRNNAAVIPARLHAQRPTGGSVECLLLRPALARGESERRKAGVQPSAFSLQSSDGAAPPDAWWCLLRPGKKLPVGATFAQGDDFTGTVIERTADGLFLVRFDTREDNILAVANRLGDMPLPPYIAERDNDDSRRIDRDRYQTVYADRAHQVAAAAPTAGLHFTPELLAQLAATGIRFADLTLHVGLGTFRPITAENIEDHAIHREVYEIPAATQLALAQPSGRRIAVGTTAVRSIEDYFAKQHSGVERGLRTLPDHPPPRAEDVAPHLSEAAIFIYPPRTFRGVDALITNFHQPRSTLLCLVSAFLTPGSTDGIDWLKEIYAEAVREEYRFFSYGDAMLIL